MCRILLIAYPHQPFQEPVPPALPSPFLSGALKSGKLRHSRNEKAKGIIPFFSLASCDMGYFRDLLFPERAKI